jgi:hypothetical protein
VVNSTGVVVNYFQLFGLGIQFNIDLATLSTLYQTLQKKYILIALLMVQAKSKCWPLKNQR